MHAALRIGYRYRKLSVHATGLVQFVHGPQLIYRQVHAQTLEYICRHQYLIITM